MAIRKNVRNLPPNELSRLREAHRRIMNRGDNRGYQYIAGRHGWPDGRCEHAPIEDSMGRELHLFLFWHRAYMYHYERFLQIEMEDNTIGLPWWDWSSRRFEQEGIPKAYSDVTADGQPNPLFNFRMNFPGSLNRDTQREVGVFTTIPQIRALAVQRGVDVPDLYLRNSLAPFSEGMRGIWHNYIHGFVGGDMGDPTLASYDPIFYPHHCNIDRIFAIWQRDHGQTVPDYMKGVVLSPFEMTVADVLDYRGELGYEYARAAGGV